MIIYWIAVIGATLAAGLHSGATGAIVVFIAAMALAPLARSAKG